MVYAGPASPVRPEPLVLGACGVDVGLGSSGADTEGGTCFFESWLSSGSGSLQCAKASLRGQDPRLIAVCNLGDHTLC